MEICFVLCRPLLPENIGSAARALWTMGFSSLRLVEPPERFEERARWTACDAADMLKGIRIFSTLEGALADVDYGIGTTARVRRRRRKYYTPQELPGLLEAKGSAASRTALVFGNESSGLSNEELHLCDAFSSIPANTQYSSLNVAQAVMVYAYELSLCAPSLPNSLGWTPLNRSSHRVFKHKVEELLELLGIKPDLPVHGRVLERISALGDRDIRILHFLRKQVLKKLRASG